MQQHDWLHSGGARHYIRRRSTLSRTGWSRRTAAFYDHIRESFVMLFSGGRTGRTYTVRHNASSEDCTVTDAWLIGVRHGTTHYSEQ